MRPHSPMRSIISEQVMGAYSGGVINSAYAADAKMPKPRVIELIKNGCSNPDPNPRLGSLSNPALEYDCSEKYEDIDAEGNKSEQSMDYRLCLHSLFAADFNQDGSQNLAVEVESVGRTSRRY